MTAPELRQEIIDAMKSVATAGETARTNKPKVEDAIEVEADNVMDAVERYMDAQQGQSATTHDDSICFEYNEPVLPDEDGHCSLCGAELHPVGAEAEADD